MTKKEIYRLRDILYEMKHNKEADTNASLTHEKFLNVCKEGIEICTESINKMKPL